ncbi:hypothetical protein, partial [Klebsiella pneumoniae]|uniref:hypothetical protein n=1 Tax=Klebsiella pneumoniae TaxID=573 RepID=UPI001C6F48CE
VNPANTGIKPGDTSDGKLTLTVGWPPSLVIQKMGFCGWGGHKLHVVENVTRSVIINFNDGMRRIFFAFGLNFPVKKTDMFDESALQ